MTLFKSVAYEEPFIKSLISRGRMVSSQAHAFVTLHRCSQPMRNICRQETWRSLNLTASVKLLCHWFTVLCTHVQQIARSHAPSLKATKTIGGRFMLI